MSNNSTSFDDYEIARRVMAGEINAFESLVLKYKDHVLTIVGNHIPYHRAEEIAHDVFVKAYQSLPTFKYKSGFKQWLSAIAVRTCYDFWRKEYRSREIPMSSCSEEDRSCLQRVMASQLNQMTVEKNLQQEAGELLGRALNRLSPENRMVLEMVYLEGLSVKEAGGLLGWSVANVKIRLFRSRKKLRKILAGFLED